jgi:UDP-glucose 4-epimerase
VKVLVTGGSGFLGAYVARQLWRRGHAPILFDCSPPGFNLALAWEGAAPAVADERGDVRDANSLLRAARAHRIEAVVHLACVFDAVAADDPEFATEVNVFGALNVLEMARTLGLRRVVWASTMEVFAGHAGTGDVVDDATLPAPETMYATTKVTAENLAGYYRSAFDVDNVGLRLGSLVGAGRSGEAAGAVVEQAVTRPALGRPGRVPYAGDASCWLGIEEAAMAVVAALEAPRLSRPVYNLPGLPATVAALIEAARAAAPGAEIATGDGTYFGPPLALAPGLGAAAAADLGLAPARPVEELVERTVTRLRTHRELASRLYVE